MRHICAGVCDCQNRSWSIVCTSEHQWLREKEFRVKQVQRSDDGIEKCFRDESLLNLDKQRLKEVMVTFCQSKTAKTPGREPLMLKNNTDTGTNDYKLAMNKHRLKARMDYNHQSNKFLVILKQQWK